MITSLYASLLVFLYFKLTMSVVKARHKYEISLGVGKNDEIIGIVSAHNNFSQYVSIFLILLFLVEYSSIFHSLIIHLLGICFFLGRYLHFIALDGEMNFKKRKLGMQLTIWSLLILMSLNLFSFLNSYLRIL